MPDDFDPYHKWLSIPPMEQPPDYYRLLGLELFESDPDVISNASDQRMAHIRTFQSGRNATLSQKILNEISSASVCLLDSKSKTKYDEQLRQSSPPPRSETARPMARRASRTSSERQRAAAPVITLDEDRSGSRGRAQASESGDSQTASEQMAAKRLSKKKNLHRQIIVIVGGGVLGILIVAIIMALSGPKESTESGNKTVKKTKKSTDGGAWKPSRKTDPLFKPPIPTKKTRRKTLSKTPVPPPRKTIKTKPRKTPIKTTTDPLPPIVPQVLITRGPVPDAASITSAKAKIQAKFPSASASELITEASSGEGFVPADRYVLLQMARQKAAETGKPNTALRAIREIGNQFDNEKILELKAETLKTLEKTAKSKSALNDVAKFAMDVTKQAIEEGNASVAKPTAEIALIVARKTGDNDLILKATLLTIEEKDKFGASKPKP